MSWLGDHRVTSSPEIDDLAADIGALLVASGPSPATIRTKVLDDVRHPFALQQEQVRPFSGQPHEARAIRLVEGVHLPAAGGVDPAEFDDRARVALAGSYPT